MNFVHRDPGSILCPRGRHGCRSLSLASALSRAAPVETVDDQRSPGSPQRRCAQVEGLLAL
jgi:hypothetical protein